MRVLIVIAYLGAWLGWAGHGAHPDAAAVSQGPATSPDTLRVDAERTVLRWKGTKFWGLGKHEGTVRVASGTLYVHEERLLGGSFIIDMTSIEVTDIPAREPVPRKRLRDHLLSDDFFAAATYPTAAFVLTNVTQQQDPIYELTGDLTMRGQTHPVTLEAEIQTASPDKLEAWARFSLDRQRWGVAYQGSSLTDDLVDDEIHLDLHLLAGK